MVPTQDAWLTSWGNKLQDEWASPSGRQPQCSVGWAAATAMVTIGPVGTESQETAHLGRDYSVVGVPLQDVGLSTRRGLLVPHVDGPTVHPVLFSSTLQNTEQH